MGAGYLRLKSSSDERFPRTDR